MPVLLKNIKMQNFCGWLDTELDFTDEDGSIKQFVTLIGANGCGKSSLLNGIQLLTNPYQYSGRDSSLLLRKLVYNTDYDPTYAEVEEYYGVAEDANEMYLEGTFITEEGEKKVAFDNNGVIQNELPRKHGGHCYFIDADNPMEMQKFQLENTEYADKFLELASIVYNFPCYFDKKVDAKKRNENGQTVKTEFFTDFVITKWGSNVHYKRMSDGEKKIAQFLKELCNKEYMESKNVILIDNYAMHVYFKRHPRMVDIVLDNFPSHQFITTTHSGYLIEHMREKYGDEYVYDLIDYKKDELNRLGIEYEEG